MSLATVLAHEAGVKKQKTGSEFLRVTETVNQDLQKIVGDPFLEFISTFAQFNTHEEGPRKADPKSPIQGDYEFFAYLLPGSVFQDQAGQRWIIEAYDYFGQVTISNQFFPHMRAQVSFYDVRRSIHSWVEPVLQIVPPITADSGFDYDAQPVKVVK